MTGIEPMSLLPVTVQPGATFGTSCVSLLIIRQTMPLWRIAESTTSFTLSVVIYLLGSDLSGKIPEMTGILFMSYF